MLPSQTGIHLSNKITESEQLIMSSVYKRGMRNVNVMTGKLSVCKIQQVKNENEPMSASVFINITFILSFTVLCCFGYLF